MIIQLTAVSQIGKERMILGRELLVENFATLAERVDTGIYQRPVFTMLVGMPCHRVNPEQLTLETAADLTGKSGIRQIIFDSR